MAFGTWPPVAAEQYARVDAAGAILFQTSPAFLTSVVRNGAGEYALNFVSGQFDDDTQSLFVSPADTGVARGRGNLEIGTADSAVVFMTDDAGADVDNGFYLHLGKS